MFSRCSFFFLCVKCKLTRFVLIICLISMQKRMAQWKFPYVENLSNTLINPICYIQVLALVSSNLSIECYLIWWADTTKYNNMYIGLTICTDHNFELKIFSSNFSHSWTQPFPTHPLFCEGPAWMNACVMLTICHN